MEEKVVDESNDHLVLGEVSAKIFIVEKNYRIFPTSSSPLWSMGLESTSRLFLRRRWCRLASRPGGSSTSEAISGKPTRSRRSLQTLPNPSLRPCSCRRISQEIAGISYIRRDWLWSRKRDCRNILHQKRLKLWSRKWPWKSVDNRSEKLSEGVGDLRRLSQLGQTIYEFLQAKRKVLDHRRWVWCKELVNADNFPL